MQGNHPMAQSFEPAAPPSPQTTAAGLEAWLAGINTAPIQEDVGAFAGGLPLASGSEPQGAIGPVNAAEALALGRILTAHRVTGPDGAELVVDPDKDAYYFESNSLAPLDALLQQPAVEWSPVYSEAIRAIRTASDGPLPLARLRWYAGLIATPGILSRKLNRASRYKLVSWPETEREFPQHFRIAKEMVKDPITMDEVAAASSMPYEEVVDFFNACSASGRLEAGPNAGAAPKLTRRQRLLAVLNKPLFGSSPGVRRSE
ncbi:MAG TPA: hypothetical protein VJ862_14870 [Rhodanobacteraceae bacterium]|nr:hypothetical protein [Rhodanobacteraceae bacterium]